VILKFGISGLNGLLNSMCIIQQYVHYSTRINRTNLKPE